MTGQLTYLDADGRDGPCVDTPGMRRDYLQWCRANAIEPWAIGDPS